MLHRAEHSAEVPQKYPIVVPSYLSPIRPHFVCARDQDLETSVQSRCVCPEPGLDVMPGASPTYDSQMRNPLRLKNGTNRRSGGIASSILGIWLNKTRRPISYKWSELDAQRYIRRQMACYPRIQVVLRAAKQAGMHPYASITAKLKQTTLASCPSSWDARSAQPHSDIRELRLVQLVHLSNRACVRTAA